MDTHLIADQLWEALQQGRHMPSELSGKLDLAKAYHVQLDILRRRVAQGERQSGWKVGLTAKAMQQQQNVHEPCFGYLLQSGCKPSGHTFERAAMMPPGVEMELCLTIGKTLKGPGITYEDALDAVSHVAPALEVIEVRGPFAKDLPLALADNAQQHSYVTGTPVALNAGNRELARATLDLSIDGAHVEQAMGANVLEKGGVASVAWLANKLAEFGLELQAGMHVMSGSFTKQYAIDKPTRICAKYDPFGSVDARFV
ncbi:MAG: fumarylacetoacetate hydrolase family protein [Candidimonas sp.]